MNMSKIATWLPVTNDDLVDAAALHEPGSHAFQPMRDFGFAGCAFCGKAELGHYVPTAEAIARSEAAVAAREALYSQDVADLSPDEVDAAEALYADPDIEVGSEGIGGFYAGQAEATIRTLRKAGFTLVRR